MVVNPCVGAPLAGAFFEEMIARGCNQFIACGGCGVLDPAFKGRACADTDRSGQR